MEMPLPLTRDLVLIGGGHAHTLVLRMWGMNPLPGARVTVINPHPDAPYTGMLPGHIAGHYARDELSIDIVRLARFAGARLILDRAVDLSTLAKTVTLSSGRTIRFDSVSVDIGINSDMPKIDGFRAHAIPVKPMDVFAARWAGFLREIEDAATPPNVVIIGGGIGGAEIAMAVAHRLQDHKIATVTIIEAEQLLKNEDAALSKRVSAHLEKLGVLLIENAAVEQISENALHLADGREIKSSFTIGCAGAMAQPWLGGTDLALTEDGFVKVKSTLQSFDHDNVFAVGDCAHLTFAPRPKAGVYAVRAAKTLYQNLRAQLSGGEMGHFQPQEDYLKLVSLGSQSATAEKWGVAPSGPLMWRWKDHIDRKFMDQFKDLKPMETASLPKEFAQGVPEARGPKPLCGGCGAKIPASVLSGTIARHSGAKRDDVLTGPGDDAGILKGPGGTRQVITTDHLRAFISDPVAMAQITANHALGDIWAMGAAPQSATVSLTLPPMSNTLQEDTMAEVMSALSGAMREAGAAIIGGHSTIGAEMTIGLALTGLTKSPVQIDSARVGDVLILTKPIGSGTIMAAEMQLEAKGRDVANCLHLMLQSQAVASKILAPHAHAMTDVTGFGLAGHATQMAQASGVTVALDLPAIPFMPGAIELARAGTRSSLYTDNLAVAPHLEDKTKPATALLFDPQTAGGLLAAVSAARSEALIEDLKHAGYAETAIIGRVIESQTHWLTI